jgi:hypothetical protein
MQGMSIFNFCFQVVAEDHEFARSFCTATNDKAILSCSSWTAHDPGHGFHANERGQMRFTISPTASREVLHRLLALNLDIAAREAATEGSSGASLVLHRATP